MRYLKRQVEAAVHDPHSAKERFDPGFMLAIQCTKCGKNGWAERRHIHEAVRSHIEEDCPLRHVNADDPVAVRVFYPKQ